MQRGIQIITTSIAILTLAGCGSLSRDIARDGQSAGRLVWPNPVNAIAIHHGGTFPDLDNLRQVQAGFNKQQIAALIGPPHFDEGFFRVRDWTYLFNLRSHDGTVTQCEYKILFDQDEIASSFYWNPASCADFMKPTVKLTSVD